MARILEQKDTVTCEAYGNPSRALTCAVTSDSAIAHGQVTICYKAEEVSSKRSIFLKQFKQPSPRLEWYSAYLKYLKGLFSRINSSPCKYLTSRIFRVFEDKKSLFEAMEFINGIPLSQYLSQNSFDRLDLGRYMERIHIAICFIGTLRALHDINVIHTDLKPDNIFLEVAQGTKYGFTLKLIDLDYAIMSESPSLPWSNASSLAIAGTSGYFPPERYTGQKYDKPSDIFTAGIILQEILCGNTPFPKEQYDDFVDPKIHSSEASPAEFPTFIRKEVSSGMARIIKQCLSLNMNLRPSARKLHESLMLFRDAVASGKIEQPKTNATLSVVLSGKAGAMIFNDNCVVNASHFKNIDPQAASISDKICQFSLKKVDSEFYLLPNVSANSQILLNGKIVSQSTLLHGNDNLTLLHPPKCSGDITVIITMAS